MKDWIPLLQELIWPVFIIALIFWNKTWFTELLDTIKERIREGSEFKVGPSGVSVGIAPVLSDEVNANDVIDDGYTPNEVEIETSIPLTDNLADQVSLTHRTSYWKMKNGRPYYRIRVNTHAETTNVKESIDRVVYHLHPTFKNPTRVANSGDNDFLLKTAGWGEFVLRAEVHFRNGHPPAQLNRYIDLTM